ncbi:nuclease-related domain-containing protein [Haloplasma contractile]|uniref:NERD domain-containing protein n=1 Tax=Haloplasma contractile SSD-17B TaxID=1033810 RepID=F7PVH0_9MOLU|nr:nuclease-related domain-containing protein [Haloplasma contractile]ERJ12862.1 NERD domain-containing protein [Haloplasma contractile SSD-17B]
MAKVINKHKNSLKEKYQKQIKLYSIFMFDILLIICIYLLVSFYFKHVAVFAVGLLITGFMIYEINKRAKVHKKEAKKYHIGYMGEKHVSKLLKRLPRSYNVINDLDLLINTERCQMDHLVIGPSGIYVIETKNYTGQLKGNDYDEVISQTFESSKIHYKKNPTHQIDRQMDLFKQLLYEHGYTIDVRGILFFANKHVKVEIDSDIAAIFTIDQNCQELSDYIKTNDSTNKPLTRDIQRELIHLVLEYNEK